MVSKKIPFVPPNKLDKLQATAAIKCVLKNTKAEWLAVPYPIVPEDVFLFETDTKKMKISDGVSLYKDLPYIVGEYLPDNIVSALMHPNVAYGFLQLDEDGKIPASILTSIITNGVTPGILEQNDALLYTHAIFCEPLNLQKYSQLMGL